MTSKRTPFHYKAFLSYSHRDAKWGAWLHRAIENYRVPPHITVAADSGNHSLKPVFRDREELSTSADLTSAIRDALAESEYLVVICSPHSAQSAWVNKEIEEFIKLDRADKILCFALDEPSTCRPAALADLEPLAADVRPEGDGRNGAKLKLIAGLLNVRYGELARRDMARQQRRLLAIAAAALAGITLTSGLAIYATVQRQQAIEQRVRAEAINEYLVQEILGAPDPAVEGTEVKVVDVLDRAAAGVESVFEDQPDLESDIRLTLAITYRGLGLYRRSEEQAAEAYRIRADLYGPDNLDTLLALDRLGRARFHQDLNDEAIDALTTAVEGINRELGPEANATLEARAALAAAHARRGEFQTAAAMQSDIVDIRRRVFGELDYETLQEMINLASTSEWLGEDEAAEELYMAVIDGLARIGREGDHAGILALTGLSGVHSRRGDHAAAETYARRAWTSGKQLYGEDHPETISMLSSLGNAIRFDGRYEEAEPILREVHDRFLAQLGEQHQFTMAAAHNFAGTLARMGRLEEAERLHLENLDNRRRALGERSIPVASTLGGLGIVYNNLERFPEAIEAFTETLAILRAEVGDGHPDVAINLSNLATAYRGFGDFRGAATALRELVVLDTEAVGATHRWVMADYKSLVEALARFDLDEAESVARERLAITSEQLPADDPLHFESLALVGMTLAEQQRFAEAEPMLVQAFEGLTGSAGNQDDRTITSLDYLVRLYELMEQPDDAARYSALIDNGASE